MPNTHLVPDLHYETQAIDGDLLPSAVLSTTFPIVPVSSMTLAAFPTQAYVRVGSPIRLVYVNQPAHSVTLTGADGAYWLAVHADTWTPVTSWTRQPGTHYLWRASATRPAEPDGTLLLAQVTVAGGVISAVDTTTTVTPHVGRIAHGGPTGALTFDHRLFWDTFTPRLNVAGQTFVQGPMGVGVAPSGAVTLNVQGLSYFSSAVGVGVVPTVSGPTFMVAGSAHISGITGIGVAPDPNVILNLQGNSFFNGNLGIGILPTVALDVNGNSRFRGFVTFDSAIDFNGNVTVDGIVDLNNILIVDGAVDFNSSLTVDGLLQVGGAVALLDTLTVTGAIHGMSSLTIDGLTQLGGAVQLLSTLTVNGAVDLNASLTADGLVQLGGPVTILTRLGVGGTTSDAYSFIDYPRATHYGLKIKPSDNDTGAGSAVLFANQANGAVGSIHTTSSTTAYNTASDPRLKHDVHTLTGELAVIAALRPVRFLWNSDDTPGVGFLASEVSAVLAGVITGAPDAVEPDGTIRPQMIDRAALMPWIVGAVKTLAARLAVLEDALGI